MRARQRFGAAFLGLVALALILCGAGSARAAPIGFATAVGGNLYSVDFGTATGTVIGNTGVGLMEGLALSPGGQLFGTSDSGILYSINPNTGAATPIGSTGRGDIEGLAFNGNTLLGADFSATTTTIFSINTTTAATANLVTTNPPKAVSRGMAILDANTALLVTGGQGSESLQSVNLTTGAALTLGSFGNSEFITGLGFGANGVLYGVDSAGQVLTIDPANAQAMAVGTVAGSPFFLDLTFPAAPPSPPAVPEPSSLALLSLGGLALAGWRRWRKRSASR